MSHYLALQQSVPALEPRSSPASSSRVTLDDMEDELVWLGGLHSPDKNPHHEADDSDVPEIWRREDWDCPTDILYHHADHEDAGHVTQQSTVRVEPSAAFTPAQPAHPMLDYRPYNSGSWRADKEVYDASTWDSPTDILYSHAEHDLLHGSALGLEVIVRTTSSAVDAEGVPCKPKRNAFGVEREPYNAETWDSPTDILYAHQSDGEDLEIKVDSDAESSAGIASPYTPYSAMLPTPRDSQVHLPSMAQVDQVVVRKPVPCTEGDDAVHAVAA